MNVGHFGAHGNISVLSLMPKSFTKQPSKTPLAVDDSYKHDLVLGTCILPRARPVSSTQPLTVDGLDHNSMVLPIKKLRMTSLCTYRRVIFMTRRALQDDDAPKKRQNTRVLYPLAAALPLLRIEIRLYGALILSLHFIPSSIQTERR